MGGKRWALSVPVEGVRFAERAGVAREAERLGYPDGWSLEVDGVDCFTPLAVVAPATRLRVGTAIANVYTRGPATLASSAAGLADLGPGRFCLGIGAGSQPIVEAWNGGGFARPATRVREMAQFLRRALAGERVVFHGETCSVDGFRLTKPPAEPVPIHVAALRPGMLRVAGEVGDGAILNWLAVEDVPTSIAVVRDAALRAGRDPAAIEITARLLINVDPPGPASDRAVRRHVTAHLNVPAYKAFPAWLRPVRVGDRDARRPGHEAGLGGGAAPAPPRADRAAQPRAQRHRRARLRACAGASGGGGRRALPRRARRAARAADDAEGVDQRQGPPHHRRRARLRPLRLGARRAGDDAGTRGGRGRHGQDERAPDPRRLAVGQSRLRPHGEPVGPDPDAGRQLGRTHGRAGRGADGPRSRH